MTAAKGAYYILAGYPHQDWAFQVVEVHEDTEVDVRQVSAGTGSIHRLDRHAFEEACVEAEPRTVRGERKSCASLPRMKIRLYTVERAAEDHEEGTVVIEELCPLMEVALAHCDLRARAEGRPYASYDIVVDAESVPEDWPGEVVEA